MATSKHRAPTQVTIATPHEETALHRFVEQYWKVGVLAAACCIHCSAASPAVDADAEPEDHVAPELPPELCETNSRLKSVLAALDPAAKALLQREVRAFCPRAVVLVIYHVERSGSPESCFRAHADLRDFFDGNLHFDKGSANLLGIC